MTETFWDSRTFRVLFTALIFFLALGFLRGAKETLTLFLFSILFAYFLAPPVARLERPLKSRIRAIALVYVILIGVLVGLGFLVGPAIADNAKSLIMSIPHLVDSLSSGALLSKVAGKHGLSPERAQQAMQYLQAHRADILNYVAAIAKQLEQPASHLWWLILIPILSFFFLKDGPSIAVTVANMGRNTSERMTLEGIVQDVNVMLGHYIRAQLILAGLTLLVLTTITSIMRVPYSYILGPIAGLCEFIPVVGPAVGAVLFWGIALLSGYSHLVWLFFLLGFWRVIQDYVSAPRIMGDSLEISPLAQIFSVLAGGEIGGVIGALISVPVLAIIRILVRRLSTPDHKDVLAATPVRASQL